MIDPVVIDAFFRLLDRIAAIETVREIEAAGEPGSTWLRLQESGFTDALLPPDCGGFGLPLGAVVPLMMAAAERLLPIPFPETMIARAMIGLADHSAPAGLPILLWPCDEAGALRSALPPAATGTGFALRQIGGEVALVDIGVAEARDGFGFRCAALAGGKPHFTFTAPRDTLLLWSAAIVTVGISGAMNRMLGMCIQHAGERTQFGSPLAKFQVVQHQISMLAEQSAMATAAASASFRSGDLRSGLCEQQVAAGRSVAAEAAVTGAAIAHAIHGAIGTSREHDLQLVTRRLKRWHLAFGGRDYWSSRLGAARLASPATDTSVDFIRQATDSPEQTRC